MTAMMTMASTGGPGQWSIDIDSHTATLDGERCTSPGKFKVGSAESCFDGGAPKAAPCLRLRGPLEFVEILILVFVQGGARAGR